MTNEPRTIADIPAYRAAEAERSRRAAAERVLAESRLKAQAERARIEHEESMRRQQFALESQRANFVATIAAQRDTAKGRAEAAVRGLDMDQALAAIAQHRTLSDLHELAVATFPPTRK
ncbi:MAG: hypothetical protein M0Z92_14140 [Actinomycetota bacterium]|nr:hypothetical protein [Actinomycetota bacterium]